MTTNKSNKLSLHGLLGLLELESYLRDPVPGHNEQNLLESSSSCGPAK